MRPEVRGTLLENPKRGRTSAIRKLIKERLMGVKDSREAETEAKEWYYLVSRGLGIWLPAQKTSEVSGNGHEDQNGHSSKFIHFTTLIELIPPTEEDLAVRKLEEQKRALEQVRSGFVTPEMYRYAKKCSPVETVLFSR